jgi:hypothetical protein
MRLMSEYGVTSCILEAAHDILRTSKQLLLCLVDNRRATKGSQMIPCWYRQTKHLLSTGFGNDEYALLDI